MNSFKSLNETGIVSSPEGILEAIIQRFRVTDPYQSKIFKVASLNGILAINQGDDDAIISAVEEDLGTVLEAYFPDGHELTVALEVDSDGMSDLIITTSVVTDTGSTSLAWAMQIIDDKTGLPRRVNNNGVTYGL